MRSYFILFHFLLITASVFSEELSAGYKEFKLGSSQNEIRELLKKSLDFDRNREDAISIRMEPDTEIITAEGLGFIKIGYFHFNNDKLFQIYLRIDEKKIGYYFLLKKFTSRFGKPKDLEPKSAYWENNDVKIVIEKPCIIKYQYKPIWNELVKSDQTSDSILNMIRDEFVSDL